MNMSTPSAASQMSVSPEPRSKTLALLSRVPAPRRVTVCLAPMASIAVALTSFGPTDAAILWPTVALWLGAFAVAALWGHGDAVLTALAVAVKAITFALVVAVVAWHSPVGPRDALDWIPLGALNGSTGIWFLRLIRGEAR